MSYGHNLKEIRLDAFREILESSYLIPSMRVLLKETEVNFDLLKSKGISNVEELYLATKTMKKAEALAEITGLDLEYMIVLRRMVSSYIPKPRKLEDYPDIGDETVMRLREKGIKTSVDLYSYLEKSEIEDIKAELQIDEERISNLQKLMEVTRLRYVTPLFATVLVRSGYDSIEKIAGAKKEALHKGILKTNKEQHIYKGNIGDSDAQFLIDDATVFLK